MFPWSEFLIKGSTLPPAWPDELLLVFRDWEQVPHCADASRAGWVASNAPAPCPPPDLGTEPCVCVPTAVSLCRV